MVSCEEYFEKVKSVVKEKINKENLQINFGIVQVGNNKASNRYVRMKLKDCDEVGIAAMSARFENTISTEKLEDEINHIARRTDFIIVQLPLPEHIDSKRILNSIPNEKDVDGLTLNSPYTPCTAKGVISYLEENKFKFEGSNAVVIGRSKLAGKPIAELLNKRNATVTLCHSHTKDVGEFLKNADLVISATGQRHTITKHHAELFLKKPVIVDVGINFDENGKMCGDVDYEEVAPYCDYVTPVPKGVGLLTRSALLENLVFGKEEEYV